ncbi:MAG: InlB B-repeat-containing protein [Corallococcus sp.]|nr:InlB B-repeat-containing protein [Corallococcus sp.]MCM1359568.1 InlB B-repeat-containing protein [Corallococcus sp.]MCM1395160.1 InlB B-repeat-containing protein [Corallococcus sp.]
MAKKSRLLLATFAAVCVIATLCAAMPFASAATEYEYVKSDSNKIVASETPALLVTASGYALSADGSSAVKGVAVTVEDNKVTSAVNNDMLWIVETVDGGIALKNVGQNNYLNNNKFSASLSSSSMTYESGSSLWNPSNFGVVVSGTSVSGSNEDATNLFTYYQTEKSGGADTVKTYTKDTSGTLPTGKNFVVAYYISSSNTYWVMVSSQNTSYSSRLNATKITNGTADSLPAESVTSDMLWQIDENGDISQGGKYLTGSGSGWNVSLAMESAASSGSKWTFANNKLSNTSTSKSIQISSSGYAYLDSGSTLVIFVENEVEAGFMRNVSFAPGDGATGTMDAVSVAEGEYQLPECKFTKDGYAFAGWISDAFEGVKAAGEKVDVSADMTLTATWEINTWNITFSYDGKTEVRTVEKGKYFYLNKLTNYFPSATVEEGKIFADKWLGDDGKEYKTGANHLFTGNIVLTPIFADAVTITFDLAGGTSVNANNTSKIVAKGSSVNIYYGKYDSSLGTNIPAATKENCEFLGWEMDDENKTLIMGKLEDGNSLSVVITSDTVFTAKWKYDGYTLVFRADGTDEQELLVPKGSSANLTSLTLPEIEEGKYFAGWLCDGKLYQASDSFTPTGDMTFNAAVYDYVTVTIKFEGAADVVVGNIKQPTSNTDRNFQLKSPSEYGLTAPEGKVFYKWSYSVDGTPTQTGNAWLHLEQDTTFTAVLADAITVKFYVDANGGESNDNTFSQTGNNIEGITLPDSRSEWIQNHGPKGYTLVGWSLNKNASTTDYDVSSITSPKVVTESLTLYAVWNYNYYTITLTNGLSGDKEVTAEVTVLKTAASFTLDNLLSRKNGTGDDAVTFLSMFTVAHKDLSWKDSSNNIVRTDDTVTNNGDKTFTAVYTNTMYVITFDATGGEAVAEVKAAFGATITLPVTSKTGYVFTGWFDKNNNKFESTTMPGENITLTAGWKRAYTITFDTNGGNAVETLTYSEGDTISLPNATKLGYTFVKWQKDGTDFTTTTMPAENVTLTAVWTMDSALFATKLSAISSATTVEAKRAAILDADALIAAWTAAGEDLSALDTTALASAKADFNAMATGAAADLAVAEKLAGNLVATIGGAVALAAAALILKRRFF